MRPNNIENCGLQDLMSEIGAKLISGKSAGIAVTGISLNTNSVEADDIYLALPGAKTHGAKYSDKAIAAGAIAVLTDEAGLQFLKDIEVPIYEVDDPRGQIGAIAAKIYGTENKTPKMFGITGTNGKTTTSYFIRSLLTAFDNKTGLIGTIEIVADDEPIPSVLTTPEANDVHAILGIMNEKNVSAAVMEVSSHALEFDRVANVMFDVVGFTNLTQDHLDLHGTMEEYFKRKAELFTKKHARKGVAIIDSEWGEKLIAEADIDCVSLALEGKEADWTLTDCKRRNIGHDFTLQHKDGTKLEVAVGLPGFFNVANAALATVMVAESGVDIGKLQCVLTEAKPFFTDVPGRMQVISHQPAAIVDFAHNPNAMVLAMEAVTPPTKEGKLIIVFGATGERDVTKREDMGRIAVEGASVIIITDDDPHGEPAAPIRDQVEKGAIAAAQSKTDVKILNIAPRSKAIEHAVKIATDKDTILVAGRGHETIQEVMGEDLELDDREILRQALGIDSK
ncbi:MAG: UDP-N-acetylmuramoyl-L-alanyl-D-glutamate--2,6-diaminopimelate ligase [Micrococcaceae bacterium]